MAAEEIIRLVPVTRAEAMTNRQFLRLAVRYLATDAGISQFLDIGVGLPTQGAVHEVAREVSAEARVAYVDYDPVVVSHANALLATPDRSVAVRGDLREPAALLADPVITGHLDFGRPVAVFLLAILHFISAEDDPGPDHRHDQGRARAGQLPGHQPHRPGPGPGQGSGQGGGRPGVRDLRPGHRAAAPSHPGGGRAPARRLRAHRARDPGPVRAAARARRCREPEPRRLEGAWPASPERSRRAGPRRSAPAPPASRPAGRSP